MAIPGDGGSARRPLKNGLIIRKLWGWAVVAVVREPPPQVCAPSLGLGEHTRGLGRRPGTDGLPLLPEGVSVRLLVRWGRPPGAQARGRRRPSRHADWELGWFFWILLPSGVAVFLFLVETERTRNRVA